MREAGWSLYTHQVNVNLAAPTDRNHKSAKTNKRGNQPKNKADNIHEDYGAHGQQRLTHSCAVSDRRSHKSQHIFHLGKT